MAPARKRKGTSKSPQRFKKFKSVVPAIRKHTGGANEKNSVDTNSAVGISSAGTFILLNGTVPGDNLQNRKGRRIAMQSVQFRAHIYFNSLGTTPASDYMRFILLYDAQPNGAAPALSDVLLDIDAAGATTTNSQSGINIGNADRFKIFMDEYHATAGPNGGGTATGTNQLADFKPISYKRFIRLNGLETRYNAGTAGTIADITTGSLYLLIVGLNAAADRQYALDWHTRVRFTDN